MILIGSLIDLKRDWVSEDDGGFGHVDGGVGLGGAIWNWKGNSSFGGCFRSLAVDGLRNRD